MERKDPRLGRTAPIYTLRGFTPCLDIATTEQAGLASLYASMCTATTTFGEAIAKEGGEQNGRNAFYFIN
jgi:hypothetical protein